jgi:uncharacterized protein involved in exopolysaccharide biosynthesis
MTQPEADPGTAPLDQPIDLLHYVFLLFDTKWIILLASVVCGYATLLYANKLPDIYESVALVDIVEQGDAGGIDPDNRVSAESIGLIETGFVLSTTKENYAKTVFSRLTSRKFIRFFMDQHNIYALLYKKHWDEKKQRWHEGFELDKGEAFIRFESEFISIYQNEESQIVAVAVRHSDPVLAAELANLYVKEFNDYMRQIALAAVASKAAFIEQNLESAGNIQIEQMLYRMMEAQAAAATLINGQDEYALELVDPATRSYDRYSPARKRMALLAAFLSGFLVTGMILLIEILRQVKRKLDTYSANRGRKPVIERPWSLRGILLRLLGVILQPFKQMPGNAGGKK